MRSRWHALGLLLVLSNAAWAADTPDPLAAVAWLVGEWAGTAEGEPGVSAAQRRVTRTIAGRYVQVAARSVYPRQERNPKGEIHESIDIWSYDRRRALLVLRTLDSLGFVCTYLQDREASTEGKLVLVAEHLENVPAGLKARYTYTFLPPDEYRELFELDEGEGFHAYVDGRFLRTGN